MPMIRKIIKKTPLYRPLSFAREIILFPGTIGFMPRYKRLPKDSVILVGTPLHRNLGDHLIAEAEKQFLKDCFPDRKIFEIPTKTFLRYSAGIERHAMKTFHVFITGGGWMGSLWPDDELVLQQMADVFSDCKLTILPQTIYYEPNDEEGRELLQTANITLGKCKDILLCTRDDKSYKFADNNFSLDSKSIILAPDIALYYRNSTPEENSRERAGLYLRSDREQVLSTGMQQVIAYISERYDTVKLDTIYPKPVGTPRRKKRIGRVISDMKSCDIILTDRLHAMIFAVIAGRKCIAADNKTHKVSGVAGKWLNWNSDIMILAQDEIISESEIDSFINRPKCGRNYIAELAPEFDKLKKSIKR